MICRVFTLSDPCLQDVAFGFLRRQQLPAHYLEPLVGFIMQTQANSFPSSNERGETDISSRDGDEATNGFGAVAWENSAVSRSPSRVPVPTASLSNSEDKGEGRTARRVNMLNSVAYDISVVDRGFGC
jgi:hypothetical protein